MFDNKKLSSIKISIASPEQILDWAKRKLPYKGENGEELYSEDAYEVLTSETVNYRTQRPTPGGLFCEKIFGPTKDYTCYCGNYKSKKQYAGMICPECGVECTSRSVRRERMSYIKLLGPVAHVWFLKGTPSRISLVLDMPQKDVESIVYFNCWVVINAGGIKGFKEKDIINPNGDRTLFLNILNDICENPNIQELCKNSEFCYGDILDIYQEALDKEQPIDLYHLKDVIKIVYPEFEMEIGASAVLKLLQKYDDSAVLANEFESLKNLLNNTTMSNQDRVKRSKRLEVLKDFRDSGNKPSWMILTVLPVIPPDLRPILPLDGARMGTADLNELYKKVIDRNNMVRRAIEVMSPGPLIGNALRSLQDAVDVLFDNGKKSRAVLTNKSNRPFKSLSATLKGKQGRFRQNLLGKRVDYSGRSVIAVGPDLKIDECGLPREMAITLFEPFIINKLVEKGVANSVNAARTEHIQKRTPQAWQCLDEIIADHQHPVLLNRAPTLHRLGVQAYYPKLVEGKAIRLFPLACTAFNADFDGDQMPVHVPLSDEAIWEAKNLMLGSKNILGPKDGKSIVTPTKDMVLGNYYLTMEENKEDFLREAKDARDHGNETRALELERYASIGVKVYGNKDEVITAYETKQISLHQLIFIRISGLNNSRFKPENMNDYIVTTPGKIIFNNIFGSEFYYINTGAKTKKDKFVFEAAYNEQFIIKKGTDLREVLANRTKLYPIKSNEISKIIDKFLAENNQEETCNMLNALKDLGFKYSTVSATTVSAFDLIRLAEKDELISEAENKIAEIKEQFAMGYLTDVSSEFEQIKSIWTDTTNEMSSRIYKKYQAQPNNSFLIMAESGASGNKDIFNNIGGLKGLMKKPNGQDLEVPVKGCFLDGLNVVEFFNGSHGTRKGLADSAIKTANSGYLTRKLVDVCQYAIIRKEDCGCTQGFWVSAIHNDIENKDIEPLEDRIRGRYLFEDVENENGEVIVEKDTLIGEEEIEIIKKAGIKKVCIRNVFSCKCDDGICQKCYGIDLATNKLAEVGQAVGIMAAQSIGEPGTQLTLRNINSGGAASHKDITTGLPRVSELFEAREPKGLASISPISGEIIDIQSKYVENSDGSESTNENNRKYLFIISGKTSEGKEEQLEVSSIVGASLAYKLDENGNPVRDENDRLIDLKVGDSVVAGQMLTTGSIHPKELYKATNDTKIVENYLLSEIQKVYLGNETSINDKHIEIVVRQMFRNLKVTDAGDSDLIVGQTITRNEFGKVSNAILTENAMNSSNKNNPDYKEKKAPVAKPIISGIIKSSLSVDSWLSAASFQETAKVLTDAATKGKTDYFVGLKENVMAGKLIPAGTGRKPYRWITHPTLENDGEVESE